tara:strand:+ start:50603 stop:51793 length:1191 start_codon:yes stop_codon:yes gene_type:complete
LKKVKGNTLKHTVNGIIFLCLILGCKKMNNGKSNQARSIVTNEKFIYENQFTDTIDGIEITTYTIKNKNGLTATFTNYGQRLIALNVPNRQGEFEDIVLGFNNLSKYRQPSGKYFGATIGRYGNRISKGQFSLDGKMYHLAKNNGENHLHGGLKGFESVPWNANKTASNKIVFSRISPDMEEGYPGNLKVNVSYEFTDSNELIIKYEAITDKPTPVNLTNHSFFNLKGEGNGTINDHILMINANSFTPVEKGLIPSGELRNVAGSPFDFTVPKAISKDLVIENTQLRYGLGYDHNFVLNDSPKNDDGLILAAKVVEPESGRTMTVYTNEPGLQFYSGNFLNGTVIGKSNKPYVFRGAFCLETQHFPDSPNQKKFPSTILKPNEMYTSICAYKFSVE